MTRIEVLGPLRVRDGDGRLVKGLRPAHRRLLALLALHHGSTCRTDELIDWFWASEPPATAKPALQTHISATRRLIGQNTIATDAHGYRLSTETLSVDAREFTGHVDTVRTAVASRRFVAAIDRAEIAESLWRGRPYDDIESDPIVLAELHRLEELHLELGELRAEALIGVGREDEVIADLEGLVRDHPTREAFWRHLIVARHRLGRHVDAVRGFRELEQVFADAGLEPSEAVRTLEGEVLRHDDRLTVRRPHNLPDQLTSFVGRTAEATTTRRALGESRLVTLTGPGGSGKTRLALEVAEELLDDHPDGVWFVELAGLDDPSLVPVQIASAMGLQTHGDDVDGQLRAAVRRRQTLFVIDNCEHVRDEAASAVRTLVGAGPDVSVLATSRQPLAVQGEQVVEVGALAVDRTDGGIGDAVRLFVDRTPTAGRLDDGAIARIREICEHLDGMPLAIELAAAMTRTLPLTELADRLDDRLRLLDNGDSTAPPRQRTLEATVKWSYDLLGRDERRVFERLGVFRGTIDLSVAERVCGDEGLDVVRAISRLVDQSLVQRVETPIGRRLRLLETVRSFAQQRLDAADDLGATGHRHALAMAEIAARIRSDCHTDRNRQAMFRFGADLNDMRAAIEYADRTDDRTLLLRLVGSLVAATVHAGRLHEGWTWFQLVPLDDDDLPPSSRARLIVDGIELPVCSDPTRVIALSDLGVALATRDGDAGLRAEALGVQLYAHHDGGAPDGAEVPSPQILELAVESRDEAVRARVENRVGRRMSEIGDPACLSMLKHSADLAHRCDDALQEAQSLWHLALSTKFHGDPHDALRWCDEAQDTAMRAGSRLVDVHVRSVRGDLLEWAGEHDQAIPIVERSVQDFGEIGDGWCLALQLLRLARLEDATADDRALGHVVEAIESGDRLGLWWNTALGTDLAATMLADDEPTLAAETWPVVDHVYRRLLSWTQRSDEPDLDHPSELTQMIARSVARRARVRDRVVERLGHDEVEAANAHARDRGFAASVGAVLRSARKRL